MPTCLALLNKILSNQFYGQLSGVMYFFIIHINVYCSNTQYSTLQNIDIDIIVFKYPTLIIYIHLYLFQFSNGFFYLLAFPVFSSFQYLRVQTFFLLQRFGKHGCRCTEQQWSAVCRQTPRRTQHALWMRGDRRE